MSDLIDLNSPDARNLLSAKLASPLIPVPNENNYVHHHGHRGSESCTLVETLGKRESLENNPFDMMLHKTTEYIQKKSDPFEVALERALKKKPKKNISSKTCSVDFMDDCTPKKRKNINHFKLNRTLDESMMSKDLPEHTCKNNKMEENVPGGDLILKSKHSQLSDNNANANNVPTIRIQNPDLSILSQSVLNDTLIETDLELDARKKEIQVQNLPEESKVGGCKIGKNTIPCNTLTLKVPKLRRCNSQGARNSPKKIPYLNKTLQSILIGKKTHSSSVSSIKSSIPSSDSTDLLNEAFFKSQCSDSSVFSSLSNVSAITKRNSVSSLPSSIATTNGTINRTFLESCSSEKSDQSRLDEWPDSVQRTSPIFTISSPPKSTNLVLSDLVGRLNELKTKTSEPEVTSPNSATEEPMVTKESPIVAIGPNNQEDKINKLIDVDVFMPEETFAKEFSSSSISNTSTDSVFVEGDKASEFILHEAKALAKTFEELSVKSNSGSSCDDLLSNNPSWISQLLPAFEDEALVDNLIELPASPNANPTAIVSDEIPLPEKPKINENVKQPEKDIVKDLEAQLIESIPAEQKVTAATLLFDLKKLVNGENNAEATQLLDNLERALGIGCKNNTELLTTYLSATNNLKKSPQKSSENIEIIKNVKEENMECSQEENTNVVSTENSPNLVQNDDINIDSANISKDINEKCITQSDCESGKSLINDELEKTDDVKIIEEQKDLTNYTSDESKNESFNEKVAVQIINNLGKLLNGKSEEQSVFTLLKTLGKVLSSAPEIDTDNNNSEKKTEHSQIQQTPKKSKSRAEGKITTTRQSFNADNSKKSSISNFIRRSLSVTHSPPRNAFPSVSVPKNKKPSGLEGVKKRFPSDPGFINLVSQKRTSTNGQERIKSTTTKSKLITEVDVQPDKPTTITTVVKSKFMKKAQPDVNKKGPLKAIIPLASMQRKDSQTRKITSSVDTTPPKSHNIISSTPNSVADYGIKKSPRSRPVASSTPDSQTCMVRKVRVQPLSNTKKRNFSCDISPVVIAKNVNNVSGIKASPKKISNKVPSPKVSTPKRRPVESGIPKSLTSPVIRRSNSSIEFNQHDHLLESPKRGHQRRQESQKSSPITKYNGSKTQQSPLKDVNIISPKVKPFNLISKLRRHSKNGNIMEKENI